MAPIIYGVEFYKLILLILTELEAKRQKRMERVNKGCRRVHLCTFDI